MCQNLEASTAIISGESEVVEGNRTKSEEPELEVRLCMSTAPTFLHWCSEYVISVPVLQCFGQKLENLVALGQMFNIEAGRSADNRADIYGFY